MLGRDRGDRSGVTRFRPGDTVIAFGGAGFRCHAQYRTMREDGALVAKPAGLGFEDAAAIAFGGTTALHFLRGLGRLQRGERVLVNGASGCVGVAAVQLAKYLGAHVTGVCSGAKVGLVRSLGADAVIDYGSVDFATSGERWDVIIDTVGNAPFARTRNALNENGRLLLVASGLPDLLKAPFQSMMSGRKVAGGPAPERTEDLALLAELAESRSREARRRQHLPVCPDRRRPRARGVRPQDGQRRRHPGCGRGRWAATCCGHPTAAGSACRHRGPRCSGG